MSVALSSLRPKDESSAAINAAIVAIDGERRGAETRLVELRAAHDTALVDPGKTAKQVLQLETAAKETAIEIQRLARLRSVLEAKLPAALKAEAAAELERQNAEADAACSAYRTALKDYDAAAQQIIQICRVGREAQEKVKRAVRTGQSLGRRVPFDLATIAGGLMLSDVVVLPSVEPGGAHWGSIPPPIPNVRY